MAGIELGVVIVSFNTCALLRSCLQAVFASQGPLSFRVCVVDNASDDGSADMVQAEFPQVHLIRNEENVGYPRANNQGLRAFGFGRDVLATDRPEFGLLLNPDTEVPTNALWDMMAFMRADPTIGMAGPKLVRPDGSLDLACRRSFPSPEVSLYRLSGLSRLFPSSPRFGRYNMTYRDPDLIIEVDSVVGAFMMVRGAAIAQVGLLDEQFFMYGEDLDWAFRFKEAGWRVFYNPAVTVLHVKRAASKHSRRAQIEFFRAMDIFYRKHYAADTPRWLHVFIVGLIATLQRWQEICGRLRRQWD
jgi:hypothetical protein